MRIAVFYTQCSGNQKSIDNTVFASNSPTTQLRMMQVKFATRTYATQPRHTLSNRERPSSFLRSKLTRTRCFRSRKIRAVTVCENKSLYKLNWPLEHLEKFGGLRLAPGLRVAVCPLRRRHGPGAARRARLTRTPRGGDSRGIGSSGMVREGDSETEGPEMEGRSGRQGGPGGVSAGPARVGLPPGPGAAAAAVAKPRLLVSIRKHGIGGQLLGRGMRLIGTGNGHRM
jgi:hypothetical protein